MSKGRRGIGPSVWGALAKTAVLTIFAGSAACQDKLEKDARAGSSDPATPVTVARPIGTTVTETSDHTGRADAVDSVEVRAQVAGQLRRVAFREGDIVKKDDLLFVIDPRPYEAGLARAKGALERSRADLWLAQRDATRADDLLKSKSISEHEWDTQSGALQQLTAAVQIAAADLMAAELNLEYAYVRAPVAGRMGRALVTVGNLVAPTTVTPLSTLVSVDPLYVYVDVEEARALRVPRPGGAARANAAAAGGAVVGHVGFAGEDGYPHEAAMDFIDNRIDPATGTMKLRLVVPNHDGRLTPGLFARVQLPEDSGRPGLLVSDRAVGTDQDRKFVYVVDSENKVQYRGVKLGPMNEGLRVVRDGLSPADRVVVRGLQRVRPGASVLPTAVPMESVDQPPPAAASTSRGATQ